MICIMSVPDDVMEKIFSYITYDEVSRSRLVCRRFNFVAQRVLNHGFHKVEKYHSKCLRKVKSQLPRRESERRKHPLARHCDILTAVETRLSLLGMTFMKFMDLNICCFIPGKVLDEIYRVLRYVTTEQTPIRAHEVLQELRDLSSMAMEYFDEKIAPALKKHKESGPKIFSRYNIASRMSSGIKKESRWDYWNKNFRRPPGEKTSASVCHHHKSSTSNQITAEAKMLKLYLVMKQLTMRLTNAQKEVSSLTQRLTEMNKRNSNLEKRMNEHHTLISAQMEKIKEQDLRIEVLNGRIMGGKNDFKEDILKVASHSKKGKDATVAVKEKKCHLELPQKRQLRPRPCAKDESIKKKLKK